MRKILTLPALLLTASPAVAATRLYFPGDTAAEVSPAFHGSWNDTSQGLRRQLQNGKGADALAAGQTVTLTEDTFNRDLDRQYVSRAMDPNVVFTSGVTTVTSYILAREFEMADNVNTCQLSVSIVSNDGATVRAVLLAPNSYGNATELLHTGFRVNGCATPATIGASYTTVAGDRIVVELGFAGDAMNTTPEGAFRYGQDAADCPADQGSTADCAGWIEFSNTVTFPTGGRRGP